MGTEIIADKFALLKTRGSNGVAFTHVVEDTMLGRRAVVKVSDKLGLLGLDYLKTANIVREKELPGILMHYEGGILEEESGYYLAFPELGQPSLEDYLRMEIPLSCGEALKIIKGILRILIALHGAGFFHLFMNTRNVFYRPRGEVTLKDPAFKAEFFYPLLELIAAPDFSYFSPSVMDGGMPGAEADLYALGRLSERLMDEANDVGDSPIGPTLRWLANRCREAGYGQESLSAVDVLDELENMIAAVDGNDSAVHVPLSSVGMEGEERERLGIPSAIPAAPHGKARQRVTIVRVTVSLTVIFLFICALSFAIIFRAEEDEAPAITGTEGAGAGGGTASAAALELEDKVKEEVARPAGSGGVTEEASRLESGAEEEAAGENPAVGETENTNEPDQPVAIPPAELSPALPVASFTVSPGEGQSPLQVYLDASSSHDPDGSIVSYAWSCGGQGRAIYHVFESNVIPTTITITLTVTDDGGHSASITRCVTLY